MSGSFDVSTLVFAVLAIFVVWKLRSVLGTRTGNERPPVDPFAARRKMRDASAPLPPGETGTVIRLPGADERTGDAAGRPPAPAANRWAEVAAPRATEGLTSIAALDPGFSPPAFMEGARAAYELIIGAFSRGDRAALEPLLSKEVFDGFAAAIASREAQGWTAEATFVSLDEARIEDASTRGDTAQVAVRFQSKLINVTRDAKGTVVEGSPDHVSNVNDLWTFARNLGSRDPNWKLVATEAAA